VLFSSSTRTAYSVESCAALLGVYTTPSPIPFSIESSDEDEEKSDEEDE
jgi:hypothetical protein